VRLWKSKAYDGHASWLFSSLRFISLSFLTPDNYRRHWRREYRADFRITTDASGNTYAMGNSQTER
jgi:hypothetical protein